MRGRKTTTETMQEARPDHCSRRNNPLFTSCIPVMGGVGGRPCRGSQHSAPRGLSVNCPNITTLLALVVARQRQNISNRACCKSPSCNVLRTDPVIFGALVHSLPFPSAHETKDLWDSAMERRGRSAVRIGGTESRSPLGATSKTVPHTAPRDRAHRVRGDLRSFPDRTSNSRRRR